MSIHSIGLEKDAPLVVSPARAKVLLDCGTTRLYQLLGAGELESYKDGKCRKIIFQSIERYIARRVAENLNAPFAEEKNDPVLTMLRRGRRRVI